MQCKLRYAQPPSNSSPISRVQSQLRQSDRHGTRGLYTRMARRCGHEAGGCTLSQINVASGGTFKSS